MKQKYNYMFKLNTKFNLQAKKCKFVEDTPKVQPSGSKSKLSVDAREAGNGAVTCRITSHTGR